MHILIVCDAVIPALRYGGTERVIWWLGKELVNQSHQVTYLVAKGSACPFATVLELNPAMPFNQQVPEGVDVVHLHSGVNETPLLPYIVTMHGNMQQQQALDINTVFVSANHAQRFGSDAFVQNGIDPDDYGRPNLNNQRSYIHFLGDAAWRVKNVRGAIKIARKVQLSLQVIGGKRFNFNQGIRLTFDPNVHFHGMLGGSKKNKVLQNSKAFLFPVRWHEPFGIALVESLYFGCPVFGTPYGALPEIVAAKVGFLSHQSEALIEALKHIDDYSRKDCQDWVLGNFTSKQMAHKYLYYYESVVNGRAINASNPILQELPQQKFLPFE